MTTELPPSGTGLDPASQDLPPIERTMPLAHAVLWQARVAPGSSPGLGGYPLFVTRRALEAANQHTDLPSTSGVFGFLAGDLCHCPKTGVLYVAVDLLIGLGQPIYGDKATVVTAHAWPALQRRLGTLKRHLLGWYHSHPPLGLMLAPGDVEAHARFFTRPWQVALVLSPAEAGFFRPVAQEPAPEVPLPFYEMLDPRAQTTEGRARSFVRWKNYHAFRPAAAGEPPKSEPAAASRPSTPVVPWPAPPPWPPTPSHAPPVWPEPVTRAPAVPSSPPSPTPSHAPPVWPEPPPPSPPRAPGIPAWPPARTPSHGTPVWSERSVTPPARAPTTETWRTPVRTPALRIPARRRSRVPLVLAIAGSAVLLFFLGQRVVGPGESAVPIAPVASADAESVTASSTPASGGGQTSAAQARSAPALGELQRLGDLLASGLRDYQERATLFGEKQANCRGLAAAYVAVEQRWIAYSVERSKHVGSLDPPRAVADRAFYADMDSVEAGYSGTGCPRP